MAKLTNFTEVLDFTYVVKRKMRCPYCKREVVFNMRQFFAYTIHCPFCNETLELELKTSVDVPCEEQVSFRRSKY